MSVDNHGVSSSLPVSLLEGALVDPIARSVLADWVEERRGVEWADVVRNEHPRWRDLKRAVRQEGARLRLDDLGFHALPASPPRLLQDHLAWRVRGAERLDQLLDTPVWVRASRFHLSAWRARRALPDVVRRLADLRPGAEVIELTGMAMDPDALVPFEALHTATLRVAPMDHPTTSSVRTLHLRVRSLAELAGFVNLRTPDLHTLTVSFVGDGRLRTDTTLDGDLHRAFDRPMVRLVLDSALRPTVAPIAAVASPGVRINRSTPRPWDEDWRRWVVDG